MKMPLEWLRQIVDTDADAASLSDLLTMGGLEVENAAPLATFTQVVVARVRSVARHPNADRLAVCQVDVGETALRTIVCGAPNVAAGLLVPCALPGAVLPGDMAIRSATVRGVRSEGMLCSARELGLSQDSQGLLILAEGLMPGADLRQALGLDDVILEIKTTPNRGDCLSVLGVAREIAALSGAALTPPRIEAVTVNSADRLPVQIHARDLCGRFTGRIVRGLDARATTPDWIVRRLERSGQRSIGALVDISNYVMLELGQPSHVFDLARVQGGLHVRWARAGERIALLNDQTVELDEQVGVVADSSGPEAIAGIMGGATTAVSLETTDVYLEAAFWWPEAIQGRARRFGFATEAGYRFERGVDFAQTERAIERLSALMVQICGTPNTRVGPIDDIVAALPMRSPVALRLSRLQRVLGVVIGADEVLQSLKRLGMPCRENADGFDALPPSYRFDLQREEDLIEEVARVHGYDRIPAEPPRAVARMQARPEGRRMSHDVRRAMAQAGYQEMLNFSFVADAVSSQFGGDAQRAIRVLNPIASQYAVMRSNLVGGLVENLRYNLNRQATRVRIFEMGRIFRRAPERLDGPAEVAGVDQPMQLAALAFGPAEDVQWGAVSRAVDFFDVKGDLERLLHAHNARFEPPVDVQGSGLGSALHPGRCAQIRIHDELAGWIGELHPRLCKAFELPGAPVVFEVALEALLDVGLPQVHEIPRFPALVRDIAVWIDNAAHAGAVLEDLRSLATRIPALAIVREVRLFDVFHGATEASRGASTEGASGLLNKEKSLAFRIVLQDTQRSLAEPDADTARAAIIAHLLQRWGARLRQ